MANFQPINPFGAFQEGYGVGSAINQNIQAERARQAEAARQAEQDRLYEILMKPGATGKDLMNFLNVVPPDQREQYESAYNTMTTEQRKADAKWGMETIAALRNDPELAMERIQNTITAFENDGNMEAAKQSRMLLELAKTDPNEAIGLISAQSAYNDEFRNAWESHVSTTGEQQEQELNMYELSQKYPFSSDAAKNRTMATVREMNLPAGVAEKVVELSSIISGAEGMDSAERARLMGQAEDRYNKLAENFNTQINNADLIIGLGDEELLSGAHDQALITLYNRVLDPDSVVRPSEFQNTKEAQSVLSYVSNVGGRITEGTMIGTEGREALIAAVKKLREMAEEKKKGIQDDQATLITSTLGKDAVDIIITDRITGEQTPAKEEPQGRAEADSVTESVDLPPPVEEAVAEEEVEEVTW